MLRVVVLLGCVAVALAAVPATKEALPEPGELALLLGEEDFEDYLDEWLAIEEPKWANASTLDARSGCQIRVNGDLGQPQPAYIHRGSYIVPSGNSGVINVPAGDHIRIGCPARVIAHPSLITAPISATATCVSGNQVSGAGWLNGNAAFGALLCSGHAFHEAQYTGARCFGNGQVIRVGFIVDGVFHVKFWSCFDANRFEVLYVWYEQNPPNGVHQTGVDRPSWLAGTFFPGVGINNLYTQVQQKAAIARLVGQELADKYVTTHQFLARGHLAAKTDFIFATGQRSSFYFINAAPQWQPFNAGNWNWLEQNLRARIGVAGYYTTVYTGTFGVSQLRDQNNNLVDIFLHRDANNNPQLPVPLYYYKVVYDARLRLGTAFVSINNPHYTLAEARQLTFCTDVCRNNAAFNWLRWQPDRLDIGYSFCCSVDDFRRTVPHLPSFVTNGILA